MKVNVGSRNPVKINATRAVFTQLDNSVEINGIAVASGVADQPVGDAETQQGAINRARTALSSDANYGVGFEGGVLETEHGMLTCAWCAVVDSSGRLGLGGGVNVLLPQKVTTLLAQGLELGDAMDALVDAHNSKQGPGAVGILTDGLSDRQRAYEHMLDLALAPFRRPDLYT